VSRSANDRTEVGLNYKRPLSSGLELEVLGLSKWAQGAGDSTGFYDRPPGVFQPGTVSSVSRVEAEAGETIGRSVLRYTHSPELSFEGGGEVAFNYREQSFRVAINGTPLDLPASDARIEELRGEGFVQGTWRATPELSFEGGVRVERSTITQSGDIDKERSFTYPKPRFVATWSPTKEDQLRFRVEREVGQLNFQDFISNVNLNSNVVSTGNAELKPDKTWVYEAAFEKRFWENGAAVLTFRHEDISDVIDDFPFSVLVDDDGDGVPNDDNNDGIPDERLVSGPGNIGDGTNDVVMLNVTLPLEKAGLKGGEIKVESTWQNSEVRDPQTGNKRRISGQRPDNIEVSYRQDLPEQNLTFGLTWFAGWSERYFRLEEVQSLELRNFFASFIEYKPTPQFTLRAELNNFDPYRFTIERQVFDGPRGTSDLSFVETERRNSQVIGMLRARWTFG
jgi:outer membrane receptor protein involved in Fe transport